MRYLTEKVRRRDVTDATTLEAHDLWVKVFDMTSVNEDIPENAAVAYLMTDYRKQYGPWEQRLRAGIQMLTDFYRNKYGKKGGELIEEYFYAKSRANYLDADDPMLLRFRKACNRLRELHDGLIVDGDFISRTTRPMRDGERSSTAFTVI